VLPASRLGDGELEAAVATAEAREAMPPNQMFEAMFAEATPQLRSQSALLRDEGAPS
jgi:hypothetical protein